MRQNTEIRYIAEGIIEAMEIACEKASFQHEQELAWTDLDDKSERKRIEDEINRKTKETLRIFSAV